MIFYTEPSYQFSDVSLVNTSYYFLGISITKSYQQTKNIRGISSKIDALLDQLSSSVSLSGQLPLDKILPSINWFIKMSINRERLSSIVFWNYLELKNRIHKKYIDIYQSIISKKMEEIGILNTIDEVVDIGPVNSISSHNRAELRILKGSGKYRDIISNIVEKWALNTTDLIDLISTEADVFNTNLNLIYKRSIYYGQDYLGCCTMPVFGFRISSKRNYEMKTGTEEFNSLCERFMTKFQIENKSNINSIILTISNLKLDLHKAIIKHNEIINPFLDISYDSVMSENFRIDLNRFPGLTEKIEIGSIPPKIFMINSISILKDDLNILNPSSQDVENNKHLDYTRFNSPILMANSINISDLNYIDYSTKSFLTCNRFYKIFKSYLEDIKLINHHNVITPLKNTKIHTCESSLMVYEGGREFVEKNAPGNKIEFYQLSTPREIKDFQEQIVSNIKALTNLYNKTLDKVICRAINRSYKIFWYIKAMSEVNDVIAGQEKLIRGSEMFNNSIPPSSRTEHYQHTRRIEGLTEKIENLTDNISLKEYIKGVLMMRSHLSYILNQHLNGSVVKEENRENLQQILTDVNEYAQFTLTSYGVPEQVVKTLTGGNDNSALPVSQNSNGNGTRGYSTSSRRIPIGNRLFNRFFCSGPDSHLPYEPSSSSPLSPLENRLVETRSLPEKTFIIPIKCYLGEDNSPDSTSGTKMGQSSGTRLNKLKILHEQRQISAAACKKLESETPSTTNTQSHALNLYNENIKLIDLKTKIECLEGSSSTLNNINKFWLEYSDDFLMKFEGDDLKDVFISDDIAAARKEWEDLCINLIPHLNITTGKEKYTSFSKFNLIEHSNILLEPTIYFAYDYKMFYISFMFTLNERNIKERVNLNIIAKFDPTALISSFIKMLPYPPREDTNSSSWTII